MDTIFDMINPQALASIFLAYRPAMRNLEALAPIDLEPLLQNVVQAGQSAWPDVDLAPPVFIQWVAQRISSTEPLHESLEGLHFKDLYLACACIHGLTKALIVFEKQYLTQVPAMVGRLDASRAFAEDVCDLLREKLLVKTPTAVGKLAEYSGRGALLNWLRVAAMRAAIDLWRKSHPGTTNLEDSADEQILRNEVSPEILYIKARYQGLLKDAFFSALSVLSDEQHNLIRLYYADGLSMEHIGALFRVNRSTIERRLDAAHASLLAEIKRQLRRQLRLSSAEFKSLVTLLLSQLDLARSAG